VVGDSRVFGDEAFIYQMSIEDNPPHENNILDGYIFFNEEKIPFAKRLILNGRMSIIMPEVFIIMPKELAEIKYPSLNRPDEIYTNNETTINLSVSLKNDKASNEDIPVVKDKLEQAVMRIHAASRVIDSETMKVSGINIAYFDFVTPAIDMDIYNTGGTCNMCNTNLPTLLPEGAKLTVIPPANAIPARPNSIVVPKTYTGNSATPKNSPN
jgi:hypothetical protein